MGGRVEPPRPDPSFEIDLYKYEDAHKMAATSNESLQKVAKAHLSKLANLDLEPDELRDTIPSLCDMEENSIQEINEVKLRSTFSLT